MSDCPKCPPAGAPMWLATFADLMSLLMCFFVLLLSMASMDVVKFKAVADSLKEAFGVQREIHVDQIPMGTSIIEQHFSPGQVQQTPLDEIRQSTEEEKEKIDTPDDMETAKQKVMEATRQEIEAEADKIKQELQSEIDQGLVTVETNGFRIVIRINEKGSFSSASAVLKPGFEPVMDKITQAVMESKGKVIVAGHTDDIPIKTIMYRSNWELSSSRAVTVAQYMLEKQQIDPNRFLIEGHADTHPLVPNDSPQNRAINRRVEIVIARDEALLSDQNNTLQTIQTDTTTDKTP
ncbi:MAG: flagellar motor protein MotB [Methylomonas sp.]|jgi:chemotaxis protein MotB|uniref:flagellar motor protein MotB n=1 Tax=Methylomonas sp. TaxID=418 RepID=UPI0025DAC99D|nr:flagellar motor protein MotB [Methylomonas sp.]MCK9607247.1 flagellar motor protein MotB [Methylomonas sp.]